MNEPSHTDIALLNVRLATLHEDVTDMRATLSKLADAITKLALVEQQQQQTSASVERCFRSIEKIESRLAHLESQLPTLSKTSIWTERGVLAVAGAALMYVAKKVGFFS